MLEPLTREEALAWLAANNGRVVSDEAPLPGGRLPYREGIETESCIAVYQRNAAPDEVPRCFCVVARGRTVAEVVRIAVEEYCLTVERWEAAIAGTLIASLQESGEWKRFSRMQKCNLMAIHDAGQGIERRSPAMRRTVDA